MKVTYIDHMGSDLSVVNAARVSFGKMSTSMDEKDKRLIMFLARENHWTPFGHTTVTMHFKAPLFVARQLGKHQVGLVWNEVSRRYVDGTPEFYTPEVWRKRADNVKQGSSDEAISPEDLYSCMGLYSEGISEHMEDALTLYESMLQKGICPEQARMVLPQSMYTEWYWTGSIAAFSRVYKLRMDPHTQRETSEVAAQIGEIIKPLYPVSWKGLTQC